jgi:hypothetical protein
MKNKKSKLKELQEQLDIPVVIKRKPEPPKPPKDREVHLGGFSRHKRY